MKRTRLIAKIAIAIFLLSLSSGPAGAEGVTTPQDQLQGQLIIRVFVDRNGDGWMGTAEGAEKLMVLVSVNHASVLDRVLTSAGIAVLTLPTWPQVDWIQINIPYLQWSSQLEAPLPGEVLEIDLRLEQPIYPAYLP